MEKERFQLTPTVDVYLRKGNKILLSRRFNTGWQDGNYSCVGGHPLGDEPLKKAAAREVKEEIGVEIKLEDLKFAHVIQRRKNDFERLGVVFFVEKWQGEPQNMEAHLCDDLRWFDLDELPENIVPYMKQSLDCIKRKIPYSEFGW